MAQLVPAHKKGAIRFDPTINLGHILTFFGILIAGVAAWQSLEKRIIVLEEGRKIQVLVDGGQDQRAAQAAQQLSGAVTRLDHQVERLADKLDKREGLGK